MREDRFVRRAEQPAFRWLIDKPQADLSLLARRNLQRIVSGAFGAFMLGIHRAVVTLDQVAMEGVLHIWGSVGITEDSFVVGFILREQQLRRSAADEPALAVKLIVQSNNGGSLEIAGLQCRTR